MLELDRIRVVGKEVPETIFALLGDDALRSAPEFARAVDVNARMLAAYRAQDWDGACGLLEALQRSLDALGTNLADYIAMYRSRMDALRDAPPGPDWDGVFSSTKK